MYQIISNYTYNWEGSSGMAWQSLSKPQHRPPEPHGSSKPLHTDGLVTIGPQLLVPFKYRQTWPISQQVSPQSLCGGQSSGLHSLKKNF
mgnify:FL=1